MYEICDKKGIDFAASYYYKAKVMFHYLCKIVFCV